MDEEGVRMTRLRRRLSVEQTEDVSSPSTPTKKRASKLIKPALDNIAENAVVDSPRRTTRRSIAQESAVREENVSTSAKKTTLTKANSDSVCAADSPRPIRATRRNSFAGSEVDTSTALTPVRRSRRLSKDCKSPDTMVEIIPARKNKRNSTTPQDVITEETEKDNKNISSSSLTPNKSSPKTKNLSPTLEESENIKESSKKELVLEEESNMSDKSSPSSIRKSPRLSKKMNTNENALDYPELNRENVQNPKGSKKRSKSFTNLERDIKNDSGIYYSDNESRKNKKPTNKPSVFEYKQIGDHKPKTQDSPNKKFKNKTNNQELHTSSSSANNVSNEKNIDNNKITSTIFMEESDVNEHNINHIINDNKYNDSCEPMEVDETIPEINISNKQTYLNKSLILNQEEGANEVNIKPSSFIVNDENKSNDCTNNDINSTISMSVHSNKDNIRSSKSFTHTPKLNSSDINMNGETSEKENSCLGKVKSDSPINHRMLKITSAFTSTPVSDKKECDASLQMIYKKHEFSKQEVNDTTINHALDTSDEEEEKSNSVLDNEAESAGEDYESGDSRDESERKYEQENEIPTKGDTLESEKEEESDDSDYEKDSFVVSSDEDDYQLLSGSDDLDESDIELTMSKKSKEKYNKRKQKEQKHASKEMFEARHGKSKERTLDNDSEDSDIIFSKKNNRMRLDSSKDTTDVNIVSENEITLLASNSIEDKDPLTNSFIIKEEVFGNSVIDNTLENVDVNEDVTVFMNRDNRNPFDHSNDNSSSESVETDSDDREIFNHFDNMLKGLNNSKDTKVKSDKMNKSIGKSTEVCFTESKNSKQNISLSEVKKATPKKNDSLIDKLNLTTSKDKKVKQSVLKKDIEVEKDPSSTSASSEEEECNISTEKMANNSKDQLKFKNIFSANVSTTRNQNVSLTEIKNTKSNDNSLIDKLNLTNGGKNKQNQEEKQKFVKSIKQSEDDESSTDGIDFKLLFTQDGNSTDTNSEDNFIPLKRSEASTNLLEKLETSGSKVEEMDISPNKEKKSKKKNREKCAPPSDANAQHGPVQRPRKRKGKDDHGESQKIFVASSENRVKIHRLPEDILDQLEEIQKQKSALAVTATSHFEVQSVISRKSKPSHYLEESIHIDQSPKLKTENKVLKRPKVLPSISKGTTSRDGCTSNFKVRVLKTDKRLDAKLSGPVDIVNFKQQRLYGTSVKRIATEELCRKQKKLKMTKF